ncbi:biofilm/acid-resistance regulator YmgB/AriR [Rahnella victoriana]
MYDTFSMLKGRPMTRKNIDTSNAYAASHSDSMSLNPSQSVTDSVRNSDVYQYFSKAGELFLSETEVLGAAIRQILAEKGTVTNKAIILHLITRLECTTDVVQLDILRSALEMVVGMTPDDFTV